jgi:AraC family transcriptional regulator, transcriptional activator of the genes for pyochelin and ferripyochelin receptors
MEKGTDYSYLFKNSFVEDGINSPDLIEKTISFNLPFAEVRSQNLWFNGIRICYSDWNYLTDSEYEWVADMNLVTLVINIRGKISTSNPNNQHEYPLGNYQHNLSYSPNSKGKIKNHDMRVINLMIQFTVEAFQKITSDANGILRQFADNVSLGKTCALSEKNLYLDAGMLKTIDSIINCRYKEGLKKMFLHSKCLELLVMQADIYNKSILAEPGIIRSDYDKERILYAREYILEHISCPPGLNELSRLAGINEFKLKKGFKEMFGNTVFGYLSDVRMEIAKTELLDNKKTAIEIASELGYSSVQHFSNAFKKKFGISPRNYSG